MFQDRALEHGGLDGGRSQAFKTTHPANIMGKNSDLPGEKSPYFKKRSPRVGRLRSSFALVVAGAMSISLHSGFPVS
jgi:hypothetical protein